MSLSDLPNELLHHIATLTPYPDVLNLARVSHRFLEPARRNTRWRIHGMPEVYAFLRILLRQPSMRRQIRAIDFSPVETGPSLSSSSAASLPSLPPVNSGTPPPVAAVQASSPSQVTTTPNDFVFKLFTLVLEQCSHLRILSVAVLPTTFEGQHELVAAIGGLERVHTLYLGGDPIKRRTTGGGEEDTSALSIGTLRALLSSFARLRRLETSVETWIGDVNQLGGDGDEDLSLCIVDHLRLRLDDFRTLPHLPLEDDSLSTIISIPRSPFLTSKEVLSTLSLDEDRPSLVAAREKEWVVLNGREFVGLVAEAGQEDEEWEDVRVVGGKRMGRVERGQVGELVRRRGPRGGGKVVWQGEAKRRD
ncbi:hypothetical protein BCR35DRAFT_356392 [Leucosporidium creatinivorum]|uniref:F-box domain-containing protein n=1 Tax=Leucosporidium creatinivorum TaxID=106004 RepID=A0A1Y2C6D4_9BASI|nr:hypothetical protein BCR35DRAFT_356392 [Leucosporidium creatinivorum]